jgi:hypothetical protein
MLFMEIIRYLFYSHTIYISIRALRGQVAEFVNITRGGPYSYHWTPNANSMVFVIDTEFVCETETVFFI